jgi:hypothetical protein
VCVCFSNQPIRFRCMLDSHVKVINGSGIWDISLCFSVIWDGHLFSSGQITIDIAVTMRSM